MALMSREADAEKHTMTKHLCNGKNVKIKEQPYDKCNMNASVTHWYILYFEWSLQFAFDQPTLCPA